MKMLEAYLEIQYPGWKDKVETVKDSKKANSFEDDSDDSPLVAFPMLFEEGKGSDNQDSEVGEEDSENDAEDGKNNEEDSGNDAVSDSLTNARKLLFSVRP